MSISTNENKNCRHFITFKLCGALHLCQDRHRENNSYIYTVRKQQAAATRTSAVDVVRWWIHVWIEGLLGLRSRIDPQRRHLHPSLTTDIITGYVCIYVNNTSVSAPNVCRRRSSAFLFFQVLHICLLSSNLADDDQTKVGTQNTDRVCMYVCMAHITFAWHFKFWYLIRRGMNHPLCHIIDHLFATLHFPPAPLTPLNNETVVFIQTASDSYLIHSVLILYTSRTHRCSFGYTVRYTCQGWEKVR